MLLSTIIEGDHMGLAKIKKFNLNKMKLFAGEYLLFSLLLNSDVM